MMGIVLPCECGKQLRVKEELAGKKSVEKKGISKARNMNLPVSAAGPDCFYLRGALCGSRYPLPISEPGL
jgi:hypothetical protein